MHTHMYVYICMYVCIFECMNVNTCVYIKVLSPDYLTSKQKGSRSLETRLINSEDQLDIANFRLSLNYCF